MLISLILYHMCQVQFMGVTSQGLHQLMSQWIQTLKAIAYMVWMPNWWSLTIAVISTLILISIPIMNTSNNWRRPSPKVVLHFCYNCGCLCTVALKCSADFHLILLNCYSTKETKLLLVLCFHAHFLVCLYVCLSIHMSMSVYPSVHLFIVCYPSIIISPVNWEFIYSCLDM